MARRKRRKINWKTLFNYSMTLINSSRFFNSNGRKTSRKIFTIFHFTSQLAKIVVNIPTDVQFSSLWLGLGVGKRSSTKRLMLRWKLQRLKKISNSSDFVDWPSTEVSTFPNYLFSLILQMDEIQELIMTTFRHFPFPQTFT